MNFYTFYTNLTLLFAYIYGIVKPILQKTNNFIKQYFIGNTDTNTDSISIFVSNGTRILPFQFNLSKFYKEHILFYVVVKIDTHEKVLVFNSLDHLLGCYSNLIENTKARFSKFSKYLDARNSTTKDECLDTFIKYTDRFNYYFSDITNYHVKPKDLYDFNNKRFLLSHGDKLYVTKMDLSNHEYHYDEQLTIVNM